MNVTHILFDLDGTLLPMNQEKFVKYYMPLLAKFYLEQGALIVPNEFIQSVWQGYDAMIGNDGSRTNREAFWDYMSQALPISREKSEEIALHFYETDFNQAACVTSPSPLSDQIIKEAKKKNIKVYLATNPVFPRCATLSRIKWAGLDADDFETITTYEGCRYCKPNIGYYKEILKKENINPEECLMVGNDVEEDLVIRKLGVRTFLVINSMENKHNLPIETEYMGTLEELLRFVKTL